MAALHLDAPVTRPVEHHLGGRHSTLRMERGFAKKVAARFAKEQP
jgi:hypothetical protein